MTTATRPRCDTTWPAIDRAGRRSPIPHTCRRALAAAIRTARITVDWDEEV